MRRYEDFRVVTRDSLHYALSTIGLAADSAMLDRIVDAYNRLSPYPEAAEALSSLGGFRLAILSNGSPDMLDALVRHSQFDRYLEAVISVDSRQAYKPDPRAYELIQERLGVDPRAVLFISSNGFDVAGARSFGLNVIRVERVTQEALRAELGSDAQVGAAAMFRALRSQAETLSYTSDAVIGSLTELPGVARTYDLAD
jgi:2-haloacid dehalogenase